MLRNEQLLFSQMFYILKVHCEIFLIYEAGIMLSNHWINLLIILRIGVSLTGVKIKTSEQSCNPSNCGFLGRCMENF